jgi:L-alanine-DL-glutamate epimerase-like enolase superfamily enzyme
VLADSRRLHRRIASLHESALLHEIYYAARREFKVPVCPHAGGVGLCEYVQHLSAFDYICVSATLENRVVEYVDHLHEHFLDPVRIRGGRYLLPEKPGYSIEIRRDSLDRYRYPGGAIWSTEMETPSAPVLPHAAL